MRFPHKRKGPIAKITVVAACPTATALASSSVIILAEVLYPAERVLVPGAVRNFDLRDGQVEAIVYAASPGIRGLDERGRHRTYRIGKVRRIYPHIDGVPVVAAWRVAEEHRPATVHWNVAGRTS